MAAGAKRILLTGGSGMVGRNLLEAAEQAGMPLLAPSSAELDLRDTDAVDAYFAENDIDLVIHAAGRVGGIQANMAQPVAFLSDNLAMGQNVILGALKAGVPELLNLASTCIYPRDAKNPLREEMILKGELEPTNEGYALAKIAALRLCEYIMREHTDLNYKSLVPCNLYGFHDSFAPEKSHLVPAVIRKVHEAKEKGETQVEIWGDGTARREFMFAADLADAILRAADDMKGLPGVMNVGLGEDHSINEYYMAVAKVVGWDGNFTHDLTKPVGMKQKLCAIDRQKQWGWTAPTSLEDGLRQTYAHFLQQEEQQ